MIITEKLFSERGTESLSVGKLSGFHVFVFRAVDVPPFSDVCLNPHFI